MSGNSVLLSDYLGKLQCSAVHHHKKDGYEINSLTYDNGGDKLVAATKDNLRIYDCKTGLQRQMILSKRYGLSHVTFTHDVDTVLCGSMNGSDHTIRLLSLHQNKFERFFSGHNGTVTGIEVSPLNDMFLSSSIDRTVRLWDQRVPKCCGMIRPKYIEGEPLAAYDPQGMIFGVVCGKKLKLYDAKKFSDGPFVSFNVELDEQLSNITFSADGKYILVSSKKSTIHLFDSFEGTQTAVFSSRPNVNHRYMPAYFTPDAQHVISGSSDGHTYIWNLQGKCINILEDTPNEPNIVRFNPKYLMLASASTRLTLYTPSSR